MSKPFDAALKELITSYPADWLEQVDERPRGPVRVLTPDLSAVSAFADAVLEVGADVLHIDVQSGPDPNLSRRLLLYNALLHERYGKPVHTVLVLLRPKANARALTGELAYAARPGRGGLSFRFECVRVWERPAADFLAGGLGWVPMAVLGRLPQGVETDAGLRDVVLRMVERLARDAPPEKQVRLLATAYILTGLRVKKDRVQGVFEGVPGMEESSSYQLILEEGASRALKKMILRLGQDVCGSPPSAEVKSAINGMTSLRKLERLTLRVPHVKSWDELMKPSRS